MSNVVYLGHLPDGFVEKDMWKYFSQFGRLRRLKLFRSKKTGRSRCFAFIQFADEDVANIVATTMNNYLMFDKIIKCHVVPKEKLHQNMFKNWRNVRQPSLLTRKLASKQNGVKNDAQILAMKQRLAEQIEKQNKKLADFGINYSFPVTWAVVKDEVKEEIKDETDEEKSWANRTDEIHSEYSMIVDSSDDEITLRTPEKVLKRSKSEQKPTKNESKTTKNGSKMKKNVSKTIKNKSKNRRDSSKNRKMLK